MNKKLAAEERILDRGTKAHPTRALACALLNAALGLGSASGCIGCSGALPNAGEQPVKYTFDHGTEGWVLNKREGGNFINLGAGVPDGGSPPTLSFAEADGDPSPGSLRLTVVLTAIGQYAAAGIVFDQARDLSSKTLHARLRLVSGSPAADVWLGFYACGFPDPGWGATGTFCTDGAMAINAAQLAGGAWAPLAFAVVPWTPPIGSIPGPTFLPASVVELGIEVYTPTPADGGAANGGASARTGDLIFEIDTVTD